MSRSAASGRLTTSARVGVARAEQPEAHVRIPIAASREMQRMPQHTIEDRLKAYLKTMYARPTAPPTIAAARAAY